MKKFDLTWGESVVVRQALSLYLNTDYQFDHNNYDAFDLEKMAYTNHYGEEDLVKTTKKVILDQTGLTYRHVLLTNGAAGGIMLALRAFKQKGLEKVLTDRGPYFPIYPTMFSAASLNHVYDIEIDELENTVFLLDSPSNPLGIVRRQIAGLRNPDNTIWDAVYHNKIYAPTVVHNPVASIMVGSYSKLLGINGIRIGWVATNDDLMFERLKPLADAEYCGLSRPSQEILTSVLKHLDWEGFEKSARLRLDTNRGEWERLEKFFGGDKVNPIGMFYYGYMDYSAKKLFDKAGVRWVTGGLCGHTDEFGRFNLAQDCNLILQAVTAVLKADRI